MFFVFFDIFLDVFLEGLRAPFWEDFGMIWGMVLGVFSEKMCGARPCKKHRFDIVFVMFQAHWPFQKKSEKSKTAHIFRHFLWKGPRHKFLIDFAPILRPFFDDFEAQSRKKRVSNKREKKERKNSLEGITKSSQELPGAPGNLGARP